jgi:hypothetical protein
MTLSSPHRTHVSLDSDAMDAGMLPSSLLYDISSHLRHQHSVASTMLCTAGSIVARHLLKEGDACDRRQYRAGQLVFVKVQSPAQ